nr:tRNA pseudouridine(55) synthase TruB [Gloeobacter violaceus]
MAKRCSGSSLEGFLNLDKPAGLTSHDCIARLRRVLGERRIGHGGTLDPAATGVLPVAVGRATRLLRFLSEGKVYRATVRFGLSTDTDDLEGNILADAGAADLDLGRVQVHLQAFRGTISQVPPRYSAIHQEGERLYDLARRGVAIAEIAPRTVEIQALTVLDWYPGHYPELQIEIACSTGTYIRSIARDLGTALGTGATLARLLRTRSGPFALEASLPLAAVEAGFQAGTVPLIGPRTALAHLAAVHLEPPLAARWLMGQRVPGDCEGAFAQIWECETDRFLGVAACEAGSLQPLVVLPTL